MSRKPIEKLSLLEFQARFQDEESCIQHLAKLRWPEGFHCPLCGNSRYYWISKRQLFQCVKCRHQTSITSGTVMHNTKLPLLKWFWAIYLCVTDKRGLSAMALKEKIGVSYPTAWFMLHKIRTAMAERDSNYQLLGVIEMDDGFIGGKSNSTPGTGDKSGRGTDKAPIIIALSFINEKPAFLKIKHVESVCKTAINDFINDAIEPGSTIFTDGLASYNDLTKNGYIHTPKVYKKEGPEYLKWIHTIISNLKSFFDGTYHGLQRTHLQPYLDEFCYRFNRRRDPLGLFDRLALATMAGSHLRWKDLVVPQQSIRIAERC